MEEKVISAEKVKEVYNSLKPFKKEISIMQVDRKEIENKIKEKIAELQDLQTKEGKPDISKVNTGLLSKAIELFSTGNNKLAVDLETVEQYNLYIKNKDIPKNQIDRVLFLAQEEKATKSELTAKIKEYKKDTDEVTVNAVISIIDEEIKKEQLKEIDSSKKEGKSIDFMQKFLELVSKVRKIIKEGK